MNMKDFEFGQNILNSVSNGHSNGEHVEEHIYDHLKQQGQNMLRVQGNLDDEVKDYFILLYRLLQSNADKISDVKWNSYSEFLGTKRLWLGPKMNYTTQ